LKLKTFLLLTIIFLNVQKDVFYIKTIFSDSVIGTPLNFGGMTGRALAVIRTYAEEENCEAIFRRSGSEFIILRMHL
jgi:hypothetical protein